MQPTLLSKVNELVMTTITDFRTCSITDINITVSQINVFEIRSSENCRLYLFLPKSSSTVLFMLSPMR